MRLESVQSAAQPAAQPAVSSAGVVWIKLAVLYLAAGVALGMAMGMRQDFTLRPVHAHVNLLGWTTLALAGIIYSIFPQAGNSVLARVHFWLMNLALPVMMGALAYVLTTGDVKVLPALVVSELAAAAAIVAFAANLFLNLGGAERDVRGQGEVADPARVA